MVWKGMYNTASRGISSERLSSLTSKSDAVLAAEQTFPGTIGSGGMEA